MTDNDKEVDMINVRKDGSKWRNPINERMHEVIKMIREFLSTIDDSRYTIIEVIGALVNEAITLEESAYTQYVPDSIRVELSKATASAMMDIVVMLDKQLLKFKNMFEGDE